MEDNAYNLGNIDAALAYGLSKEAWLAPALSMAVPAIMGGIAAPEGETEQGVALGALGGLAGYSALRAGAHALGAKTRVTPPVGGAPGSKTVLPSGAPVPNAAIPQHIHEAAIEHSVNPQELYARRMQQLQERQAQPVPKPSRATVAASKHFGTDPAMVTEMMNAPGPMKGATPLKAPPAASEKPATKGRKKAAGLGDFKIAVDVSTSVGVPGMSMGFKDQRERLPGMSRWVPRSTVERGFDYADDGIDPEAVADLEAERGSLSHPLLGAALAAAGARKFMPNSGLMGPLLAGLGGAGLGALHHQATKGRRIEEGTEAHQGALRERERFPIQRHAIQTANESTPLAVSRGHGDA